MGLGIPREYFVIHYQVIIYLLSDDYDQADPSYEPIEEEDYEMAEEEEQETKVGIL